MLQFHLVLRLDPGLGRLDPLFLGAPINVALGLEYVGPAATEAEHRSAHRFDADVTGEDEQVGPADLLAVFLLDRPKQAAGLVEVAIVRPAIERSEALLSAVGAAAPVGGAIGPGSMPGHPDHERPVMAIVGRPPRLAVGHQRDEVGLERRIIDRVEGVGVVEVLAHRVGRAAKLVENVEGKLVRPPVVTGPAEQLSRFARGHRAVERRAAGLGVHG